MMSHPHFFFLSLALPRRLLVLRAARVSDKAPAAKPQKWACCQPMACRYQGLVRILVVSLEQLLSGGARRL